MSDYCSYSGIRLEIAELEGKKYNEVYPYFQQLIGEAEDVDSFDGEIEYFTYSEKGKYRAVTDGKKWGIDIILDYKYGEVDNYIAISLQDVQQTVNEFCKDKNLELSPEQIRVVSYNWYNGVEEPIKFK